MREFGNLILLGSKPLPTAKADIWACKILPGLYNSAWLAWEKKFDSTEHGTFTHKTPIYTHEQIVSVYYPYYIILMIMCHTFYKIPMLVFSPATQADVYKTFLPQLTRRASANCLLPIASQNRFRTFGTPCMLFITTKGSCRLDWIAVDWSNSWVENPWHGKTF
jgi:hypothetical protein